MPKLKSGATARGAGLTKGFLRGSGGLVLSAGVDWTVKLWAPGYRDTPLMSIVSHSYDYMSDVQWSPAHPALFATASSNGTVGLWNLAQSLDKPLTGTEGIVVTDAAVGRGLNRIRWSLDGRRLAVACSDRLHMLSLSQNAIRTKGDDDANAMMNQLQARGWISR
jgi:dynein intermediate chain, cytosolic